MKQTKPHVVFEPAELANLLQRDLAPEHRPIVVDVRPESAYQAGHLRGAVWLNLAEWVAASRSEDGGLDRAPAWYDRIGKLGVGPNAYVVVCDDGTMVEAARIWFILQHFGVVRAAVLNGGYPAIERLVPRELIATGTEGQPVKPVAFRPKADAKGLVTLADKGTVLQSLEGRNARILDARKPAEYSGAELMKNPRGGHLPGAVNLSHVELLDGSNKLKSPEQLRELFASAGLKPGDRIITHCQGGGRAALATLAAIQAGYGSVANYYMSFGEWAADERCPLATPASNPSK